MPFCIHHAFVFKRVTTIQYFINKNHLGTIAMDFIDGWLIKSSFLKSTKSVRNALEMLIKNKMK
jgi:hypothetical protein